MPMPLLQQRGLRAALALIVVGAPVTWLLARDTAATESAVVARVKQGEFVVTVTTSGELRARKFVQITVPPNVQEAEVYQMKIASIVPEGTVVKEGDVVAELDRSTLAPKMAEVSLALQKAQAVYEQAMLDSTLNLSKAREDIRSMELGLEEKRLAKEQAAFEAPTVRRQAEIDYEKAERALAQARAGLQDQDRAGPGQDARGRCRPRPAAEQAEGGAGGDAGLHHHRPRARDGHLRQGVERPQEHHRLAGQLLGPRRGDAARPDPDGVGHLRQRDRRAEDRDGPAGRRSPSIPTPPSGSPAPSPASPMWASSGPTPTPRCSRSR